jgi:hypothetical protein
MPRSPTVVSENDQPKKYGGEDLGSGEDSARKEVRKKSPERPVKELVAPGPIDSSVSDEKNQEIGHREHSNAAKGIESDRAFHGSSAVLKNEWGGACP